ALPKNTTTCRPALLDMEVVGDLEFHDAIRPASTEKVRPIRPLLQAPGALHSRCQSLSTGGWGGAREAGGGSASVIIGSPAFPRVRPMIPTTPCHARSPVALAVREPGVNVETPGPNRQRSAVCRERTLSRPERYRDGSAACSLLDGCGEGLPERPHEAPFRDPNDRPRSQATPLTEQLR